MSGDCDQPDRAAWTRVDGLSGRSLDLLDARFRHRHYAPHAHEEWVIGVCTEGVGAISYRGERHHATAGTIVVLEPGEAHTGGPAGPGDYAYRAMYPTSALLAEVTAGNPHFRAAVCTDPELAGGLRLAHVAMTNGAGALEIESRVLRLLAALVGRHAAPGARPVRDVPGGGRIAREVIDRLASQLLDPPTLAEVAADLGLSRYQVLRTFRETMGMPPYAWLAQHRVARARVLLEAGRRPAEVAPLVGFADQAHLTRWFRRVLGVTPGAYRNSVQDSHPLRA